MSGTNDPSRLHLRCFIYEMGKVVPVLFSSRCDREIPTNCNAQASKCSAKCQALCAHAECCVLWLRHSHGGREGCPLL